MKKWTFAAVLGLAAAMAVGAFADGLPREQVASGAAWVAHLDCDQLRGTKVGQFLLDEMKKPEAENKLAAFKAVFNFDPRQDVKGVTLYGVGENPHDAIALVRGKFDVERLVTLGKANSSYKEAKYQKYTVHSWIDEKRMKHGGEKARTFAAAHGSGVIVFGPSLELVGRALDVLDGSKPSLKGEKAFADLDGAKAMFVLAGANFGALAKADPKAELLKKAKYGSIALGENGRDMELTVRVEADDQNTAAQIQSVAQGMVALMNLQSKDPNVVQLAQKTTIAVNGALVSATIRMPTDDLIKMMREKANMKLQIKIAPDTRD